MSKHWLWISTVMPNLNMLHLPFKRNKTAALRTKICDFACRHTIMYKALMMHIILYALHVMLKQLIQALCHCNWLVPEVPWINKGGPVSCFHQSIFNGGKNGNWCVTTHWSWWTTVEVFNYTRSLFVQTLVCLEQRKHSVWKVRNVYSSTTYPPTVQC